MSPAIPQRVLIATQNSGKVREFRRLLEHIPAQFVGLEELPHVDAPSEDGATFLDNAKLKALLFTTLRFNRVGRRFGFGSGCVGWSTWGSLG